MSATTTSSLQPPNTTRVQKRGLSTSHSRRSSRDALSPMCDGVWTPPPTLPAAKLAKLRTVILDYLKELETKLSQVEPRLRELWEERLALNGGTAGCPGSNETLEDTSTTAAFHTVIRPRSGSFSTSALAEARARVLVGLDMLKKIRADVSSHIPERLPSVTFEKLMPDFATSMHMPHIQLPDFELPSAAHDMSFENLQAYLLTLRVRLESLHEHLRAVQLPSSISTRAPMPAINARFSELLNKLQDPDLLTDPLKGPKGEKEADEVQISHALEKSAHGMRLIEYADLPERYKNNDNVLTGYRFIPLDHWSRLILSIFQFHNETANIWTHLVPLVLSLSTLSSSISQVLKSILPGHHLPVDIAERVFTLFANVCLLSSCIWHVMSGCAHLGATVAAARIDYVGIGWLIVASIGSVIYYGFSCRPIIATFYLTVSFCFGIAASILPFMSWFNDRNYKNSRILFFVSLVLTVIIPLTHLATIHSLWEMYTFIRTDLISIAVYLVGLLFYAFSFPECIIPSRWTWVSDWLGGGSHAIWHICIVLGIKLHRDAMVVYRNGIADETCEFSWSEAAPPLAALFRR